MAGTGIAYPADAVTGAPAYAAINGRNAFSAVMAGATTSRPLGGYVHIRSGKGRYVEARIEGPWTKEFIDWLEWTQRRMQPAIHDALEELYSTPLETAVRLRIGQEPYETYDAWWNELYMTRLLGLDFDPSMTPKQIRAAVIEGVPRTPLGLD